MIPRWRKQYVEPGRDAALSAMTEVVCTEDLAVQSFKDDADINVIMRRYGVTGELPRASVEPFYGDFSDVGSFQEALNKLREASDSFERLPSGVRRRFGNNPAELIDFVQDPSNRAEAEFLGLVPRKAPVEPVRVSDAPPPPPAGD